VFVCVKNCTKERGRKQAVLSDGDELKDREKTHAFEKQSHPKQSNAGKEKHKKTRGGRERGGGEREREG